MATTDYKSPGTTANRDRDSKAAWNNTDNAKTSNDSRTECVVGKNTYGDWLKLTNFGFTASDVPSGATIDGIEMIVERQCDSLNEVTDSAIYLLDSSASQAGDNKATGDYWGFLVDEEVTYGGAADDWNASLTQSDIVSSNFGVEISANNEDNFSTSDARIDHVEIRIHYTAAAAGAAVTSYKTLLGAGQG